MIGEIFAKFNLKLVLHPREERMEIQEEKRGIAIAYPYFTVSDTLRRLLFHLAAIKTAKKSVLIFEEPEAHAFPYYSKYLAELIAGDENNQYFISTHNPVFLLTLVEKTPKEEVQALQVYWENHQTKVRILELKKILEADYDIFFELQ